MRALTTSLIAAILASGCALELQAQHGAGADHAEPAASAKPTVPAPKSEATRPATPAKQTHTHTAAAGSGASKKDGDAGVRTAIERIQQRVAAELPSAAATAQVRPRPNAAAPRTNQPSHPAGPAAGLPPAPRISLTWRATLIWPTDLLPDRSAASRSDSVELIWK